MDRLRQDAIERARATPFEERARQALDAMRTGIRLKRAALVAKYPDAPADEIDVRLQRWLERAE